VYELKKVPGIDTIITDFKVRQEGEEFNAKSELHKKAYVQDVDLMICQAL